MQNNTIELYQERDFGQVISTTFDFLRQHFKPMFKSMLIICGPILLALLILQKMYLSSFFNVSQTGNVFSFYGNPYYYMTMLLGLIEKAFISCVIYGYLSLYAKGKTEISYRDILVLVKSKAGIIVLAGIIQTVLSILATIFLILPGIYVFIATLFMPILIIHEELSVGEASSKTFEIIKNHWWQTFGVLLVLGMITFVLIILISLPTTIIMGISLYLKGTNSYEIEQIITYVFTPIVTILSNFSYLVIFIGIGVQYFSISERKYHIKAQQRIEDLGKTTIDEFKI